MATEHESFIPRQLVLASLNRELTEDEKELNEECNYIIGVDPAGDCACHTAIVVRKGSEVVVCKNYDTPDTTKIVDLVIFYIDKYKPLRVFCDKVGLGKGIFDALKNLDLKYRECIVGVNGAEKAITKAPVKYMNRRAEMWSNMKRWLENDGVMICDAELVDQLTCIGYNYSRSGGKLQLTSKKDIKSRKISPDKADALALTFAMPYIGRKTKEQTTDKFTAKIIDSSAYKFAWMR